MHSQLQMFIAQEHIADMHRNAARLRLARQAAGAARRSQQRFPTGRLTIASDPRTAASAHAEQIRAEIPQPAVHDGHRRDEGGDDPRPQDDMMNATNQQQLPSGNAETIEAWDGPLFDRFVQYRHIVVSGLSRYGEEAMRLNPPPVGGRAFDIGCGFGHTSRRLADLVGADGSVLGLDASPRFIEAARSEALGSGAQNVRFEVPDVETATLPDGFDLAFSRFGTMFFANPVAALRNIRRALVPGGQLVMVVWRVKVENEWLYRAQTITERFLTKPGQYDAPTCGPGPFSMADGDTVTGILTSAGLDAITLRRCDLPIMIGHGINEAVEFTVSLGPAGEILRLAGDHATHLHEPVADALREGLADWAGREGVIAPSSSWIVTAATPDNGAPTATEKVSTYRTEKRRNPRTAATR